MSVPYRHEEIAFIKACISKGKTSRETAELFNVKFSANRSTEAISRTMQRLRASTAVPVEEFAASAKDVEISRLEKELAQAKSAAGVVAEWDDEWDGNDEWNKAEKDAGKRIEKARKQGRFEVSFDKPVAIVAVSDQHIAPGAPVDFKRMKEDAEIIANTDGFYAVLGGDGIDNHVKHRAAVLSARSQPDDQYKLFNFYLNILAHKTLVLITGNHEFWSNQIGGVDMVARLAEANKICYGGHEARLTVKVGGHPYLVAVRHQYRFNSSFNQTHTIKQWYAMGESPFDIGIIGHHHEHSCESFIRHGMMRWGCRPGSYQVTSAYSRQFGFADAIPTCPTFILMPGRREIIGFSDVRHAAKAFKGFV